MSIAPRWTGRGKGMASHASAVIPSSISAPSMTVTARDTRPPDIICRCTTAPVTSASSLAARNCRRSNRCSSSRASSITTRPPGVGPACQSMKLSNRSQQMNVPAKPSLMVAMATRYSMDPLKFQEVIKRTVMPREATTEHMAAYLMLCKEYGLNPLLKHVHCYISQGELKLVISVDGWAFMVQGHPKADGCDFAYQQDSEGKIVAITCTMYRKDWTHPVKVTEFMSECWRATPTWKQSPQRMLRHRALIQAARIAFGMSGAFSGEDVPESDYLELDAEDVTLPLAAEAPKPPRPPSPPKKEEQKPVPEFTL